MKKTFSWFILIMLMSTLLLGLTSYPVVASELTYLNFDEATTGVDFTRGCFTTENVDMNYFYPYDNTTAPSGSNVFMMEGTSSEDGYWNLSGASLFYGLEFEVCLDMVDGYDHNFLLAVCDSNDDYITAIYIRWAHVSDELQFDYGTTPDSGDIGNQADMDSTWYNVLCERNGSKYTWYIDDVYIGTDSHVNIDGIWADLSYIIFTSASQGGTEPIIKLDNVSIHTDISCGVAGGGGSGYGDLSPYIVQCDTDGNPATTNIIGDRYLETKWGIQLTEDTPIYAVDLYVSSAQYTYVSSDLSDYSAYVNGYYLGYPDYFIAGTEYVLRWILSTPTIVPTGYAVFEFGCTENYNDIYWYPIFEYDTYGGGSVRHNDPNWFGDGNTLVGGVSGQTQGEQFNANLWICLYHTFAQDDPEYDDDIWVVQDERTNNDEFYEYSNIRISGTLSALLPSSYVQLNHDGARYNEGIFGGDGVLVSGDQNYNFLVSFNPVETDLDGSWNCTLVRSGSEVASYNFTIINMSELDYNGHITSYPNPQSINQPIQVVWLYDKTYFNSLNAEVFVSDDGSFNIAEDTQLQAYIQGNGSTTYYHNQDGTIYFLLVAKDTSNVYHTIAVSDPQVIGVAVLDSVNVQYDIIHLSDEYPEGDHKQRVFGSHTQGGRWVQIFLDNLTLMDVSMTPFFDFEYDYYEAGLLTVTLSYLNETDVWVVLDTATYTVIDDRIQPEDTPLLPVLPALFRYIGGIIIIGVFALLPLFFSLGMRKNSKVTVNIPSVVYVLFASIGVVFTILIGFLEVWVLYFILGTGIIVLGIMYYTGQGKGSIEN